MIIGKHYEDEAFVPENEDTKERDLRIIENVRVKLEVHTRPVDESVGVSIMNREEDKWKNDFAKANIMSKDMEKDTVSNEEKVENVRKNLAWILGSEDFPAPDPKMAEIMNDIIEREKKRWRRHLICPMCDKEQEVLGKNEGINIEWICSFCRAVMSRRNKNEFIGMGMEDAGVHKVKPKTRYDLACRDEHRLLAEGMKEAVVILNHLQRFVIAVRKLDYDAARKWLDKYDK